MNFGLLFKTFILSFYTTSIKPTNLHNLLKFKQIYLIWSMIKHDSIEGNYVEFGILKGKSLYHSWRCAKRLNLNNIIFFGLDSFEGFPVENHKFYIKENFQNSYKKVFKKFSKFKEIKIVKGFFEESLKTDLMNEVKKINFAFIDCDIYESSIPIFKFLESRVAIGGFIMIDDFTSVDKNNNSIYKAWSENNTLSDKFVVYSYYSSGVVFRKVKK
jgi:hypothetical protein